MIACLGLVWFGLAKITDPSRSIALPPCRRILCISFNYSIQYLKNLRIWFFSFTDSQITWFCESFGLARVQDLIAQIEGNESGYSKSDACRIYDLPIDREADIVVIAQKQHRIG